MFRLFALATLCTCPPAYFAMKVVAVERHRLWNKIVEKGGGELDDTWHEDAINWVYPI